MSNASADEVPPIVHALSGAVASVFSNSFVYPLDLVTTRLQTQDKKHRKLRRASGTPLTHEKNYDGLRHALFSIYEEEGVSSLWHGVVADNVSTMASTFCYHFAYNAIRDRRVEASARRNGGHRPRVLGMVEELSIGAGAGVIARFVTSPASNVVTRSQTSGDSTIKIITSIYKEKGITGFWSGMKASVILAANPSISYYLFELQKALLIPKARRNSPKAIEIFLMSATGKAIATLLLYPVILLKAKTQAIRAKVGLWALIKSILERDGIAGLYEGVKPQVIKGFLSQGILMLLKDRIGMLIISGYLAITRSSRRERISGSGGSSSRSGSSGGYYFSDSPKTDVNGLIAATKDKVEEVVDRAVETVKEAAGNVSDALHVDDVVGRAKHLASNVADGAVHKAKDLVEAVKEGGEHAVEAVKDSVTGTDSRHPVRAISNAVAQGTNALNDTGAPRVEGAEWTNQTRKTGGEK